MDIAPFTVINGGLSESEDGEVKPPKKYTPIYVLIDEEFGQIIAVVDDDKYINDIQSNLGKNLIIAEYPLNVLMIGGKNG